MKQKLKQLKALKAEKEDLERRANSKMFNPKEFVADTAKDYRTGQGRTIVVRGYGDTEWQKVRDTYLNKVGKLNRQILEMEDFLTQIEDAEMRKILRLRYEDGMTHDEIGIVTGYSREAIQKKEQRFWNERKN